MSELSQCRCGSFNKVEHIGLSNLTARLETSIKYWLQYNLLCIGSWTEVTDGYPGQARCLIPANCPGCDEGTCFQTFRSNWVWDTDATYIDQDNISHQASVVEIFVNGTLQDPSNYNIDYNQGMVCFQTPPNGEVTANFPFNNVSVYINNEAPWWTEVQFGSLIPDESQFKKCEESGDWYIGSNHRIQLPTIVLYASGGGRQIPFALGRGKVKRQQDVVFHVIAEDKCMRDNLLDLLVEQHEVCITLFDPDVADLPLDCNGNKVSNNNYPSLVENWAWACTRVDEARVNNVNSLRCGLYEGMVVFDTSTVFCRV